MIGIFLFLTLRSARNSLVHRLQRLRQPRYLIATLAGLLYFGRILFANLIFRSHRGGASGALGPLMSRLPDGTVELAGCLLLFVVLALAWVVPQSKAALTFSEAEVQFLFPAPLSRRSLIHFKLLRSQTRLLIGAAVFSLILHRGIAAGGLAPLLLGIWALLATLNLHFLALGFTRTRIMEHGISAPRRTLATLGILVALTAVVVWSVRDALPELRGAMGLGLRPALEEVVRISHTGLLKVVLFPLRLLLRPILAPDFRLFALYLPGALALFGMNYLWAISAETAFEEASAEASERRARRIERFRAGGQGRGLVRAGASRRPPFVLRPAGRPEVALLWKNLIAAGRIFSLVTFIRIGVMAVLGLMLVARLAHGSGAVSLITATLAASAGLLMFLGPSLLRSDFRQDLLQLDTLKCYPLSGTSMVVGEVLSPVVILTAMQWPLLAAAALLSPLGSFQHLALSTRLSALTAAVVLAPAVNLATVLLPNALVLILPAWVSLGQNRAQGLEAMGQRLIAFAGSAVVLVLVAIPAALAGGVVYLITRGFLAIWCLPFVALAVSLTLVIEGALAIAGLGRVFEKLDPSTAGIS